MNLRKCLSGFLALTLVFSMGGHAFAAGVMREESPFPHHYVNNEFELAKISHPEHPANTRDAEVKWNDGILDYTGNGRLGVPGVDEGANGQGDRGQSYSWGSFAYGDWMYVSSLYSAMFSTMQLAPAMGHNFDPAMLGKIADTLYRGDFFVQEEDGGNPRCALSKINVKTGEIKVLMSRELNGISGQFRNAVEYHGKLYFCGSPNGIPSIWEIDPETDEFRRAYVDPVVAEDPSVIAQAIREKGLSIAIRGMTVFNDYLVISCVGPDANPYIAISNDPGKGFTKIASAWQEGSDNTVEGELLGYPACRLKDSIYGGHIWEMIPFQDKLYVSICTGTPQNSPDGGKTMQSFALMRGECPSGDYMNRDAWTWTPVVGDPDDGAAYPFGIDPVRTRAGACTMRVFGDHLYIGEYNDAEIGMMNLMFNLDAQFLADNLEQSVNLYRMDANETMELVVGEPTEQFPVCLSGLHSGFGETETAYENQYIWRMETFQDKLYVGTFDQGSLLYPIAQLSNGDLIHMSEEEWVKQLNYLRDLILEILKNATEEPEVMSADGEPLDTDLLRQLLDIQAEAEISRCDDSFDVLSMPAMLSADGTIDTLPELHRAMVMLPRLLTNDPSWNLNEQILSKEIMQMIIEQLLASLKEMIDIPQFIQDIYEMILNDENLTRLADVLRCLACLENAQQGFDMLVSEDGVHFDAITRDGLGDPYNQGLRALTYNDSYENPWLCVGTANPFYGTQIWRLEEKDLNVGDMHSIAVEKNQNGELITASTARTGDLVRLDFTVDPGYHMMNLKIRDSQGNLVPVRNNSGIYSFVMPDSDVQISAFFTRFTDLNDSDYYMDSVEWATENQITLGTSDTTFSPNGFCTRAQAITFLWRAAGCPAPTSSKNPFTDIQKSDYFYDAVLWGVENGIVSGTGEHTFSPEDNCQRSQIVTFVWRAAGCPAPQSQNHFVDVSADEYYVEAVVWAVENGITFGTSDLTFSPDASCTRAQIVSFLFRYESNR